MDAQLSANIEARVEQEVLTQRLVSEKLREQNTDKTLYSHPAFLVVLSFVLTGVVGSMLSSCWQAREWRRQQDYAATRERVAEQRSTATLTAEAVAESFTAAEDVLHLFAWNWTAESPIANFKDRGGAWVTASRKWRVAEKVLIARVSATYGGGRQLDLLNHILLRRRVLGNHVQNLLALQDQVLRAGKATPAETAEIQEHINEAQNIINETTGANGTLQTLLTSMLEPTHRQHGH